MDELKPGSFIFLFMKALKLFVASTTFALASFSCAQKNSITEVELKNDVDSISYSLVV